MKVDIKQINGNWTNGYALDKHTVSSTFLYNNEYGHPQFETIRTEAGEAVHLLKYKHDWTKVDPLAAAVVKHIIPSFEQIGLVVPVPASKQRERQPVYEVAKAVAKELKICSFENIVDKLPTENQTVPLKDLKTKEEKIAALKGRFVLKDSIASEGRWNVLVIDDLYDSGASLEAVCEILQTYPKIDKLFVATLTWK